MRASEFVTERKNYKRKSRYAAYGPGPYGGYGYYAGYSGDSSGSDGGGGDGGAAEDYDPNGPPTGPETKPTMPAGTVRVDVDDVYDWYKLGQHISNMKGLGKHDFGQGPPSTIFAFGSEEEEHKYINALKKTGLKTTDIDPVDPRQPKGMPRQKTDPTYNVNETFDEPYKLEGLMSLLTKLAAKPIAKKSSTSLADIRAASQQTQNLLPPPHIRMYLHRIKDAKEKGIAPQFSASEYRELEQWVAQQKIRSNLPENFADGKNPQDKGDSKRHGVPTKASVSTLRKVAKQGGRKGQLAHWMANMKSGRSKKK
jgi:hypothetical protein